MKSQIFNELVQLLREHELLGNEEPINEFHPIEKELRESWYVDKAMQFGIKNAIHIRLHGSFIAIVDNDKLMMGSNPMIINGYLDMLFTLNDIYEGSLFNHFVDFVNNELFDDSSLCEKYFYNDDNECIILSFEQLKNFINLVLDYVKDNGYKKWEEYDNEDEEAF